VVSSAFPYSFRFLVVSSMATPRTALGFEKAVSPMPEVVACLSSSGDDFLHFLPEIVCPS